MTTLLAKEHELGLHELYRPPTCPDCPEPRGNPYPVVEPPRTAVDWPQYTPSGFKSLGEAIEGIKARRGGRLFGDGLPPDPEPPEWPDGNPWCAECRGFRRQAIRVDDKPTTYIECQACKQAPWRIAKQYERLKLTIPERFQACRLETFPMTTQAQRSIVFRLNAWLEHPDKHWLFLSGPTGRGKTGLAVAVLFALADRGYTPAFTIVTDLLSTIKATFGDDQAESESSILAALYDADVFVLDDLGSEYHRGAEDWTSEKIFQLIAGRHAAMKPTIITSNLSLQQLERKLGHPRTTRRIVEATTSWGMIDFGPLPLIENRS